MLRFRRRRQARTVAKLARALAVLDDPARPRRPARHVARISLSA
jgi:hypothetical protein